MKSYYKIAIEKVVAYAPNVREFFEDASTYEYIQIKHFKCFNNYLNNSDLDEEFEKSFKEFLQMNNYIDNDEKYNLNLMFSELYEDLDDFKTRSNQLLIIFDSNLDTILNTGGFLGQKIDLKKIEYFLNSVEYLAAIRIKCLCYLASACILKKLYPYGTTRIELINVIKDNFEIEVDYPPTLIGASIFISSFNEALFMFSE